MLDMFNSVDMYGLDLTFYDQAIEKIKHVDAKRIHELAIKYLNWEDFLIVTAG
jgi:predicted Zn-dependent peptidase